MATGRFADALTGIGVTGVSGSTDFFTVYDFSATEQKKIAASDVLKRLLSTADVSYLPTLAVASIVHATDKFLVWDASGTTISVITASDLLNNTFAGTTDPALGLTSSTWDSGSDTLVVFDSSATKWKKLFLSYVTDFLHPSVTTDYTSTPTAVTTASVGKRLTNRGAGAILEFDLPAATALQRYTFSRITNFAVRLDPNGTETIGEGGAGKYLEITGRGQVVIESLTAGEWEVTGGSAVYTFEA